MMTVTGLRFSEAFRFAGRIVLTGFSLRGDPDMGQPDLKSKKLNQALSLKNPSR
jgi:hypothetical protein